MVLGLAASSPFTVEVLREHLQLLDNEDRGFFERTVLAFVKEYKHGTMKQRFAWAKRRAQSLCKKVHG